MDSPANKALSEGKFYALQSVIYALKKVSKPQHMEIY